MFRLIAAALTLGIAVSPAIAKQPNWNEAAEKEIALNCGTLARHYPDRYQTCRIKVIHDRRLDAPDEFPMPKDEPEVTIIRPNQAPEIVR